MPGTDVRIGHFGTDEGIAQHATVQAHGGVEGIQAGGDLHNLRLAHGFARSEDGASRDVQRRSSVGVMVFNYQVLHFLSVYKRRRERVLGGFDKGIVLESVLGQHLLHFLVRARRNLVNHGPGETHFLSGLEIQQKVLRNKSFLRPLPGIGKHSGFHFVAVFGAVVQTLDGERQGSGAIPLQQQHRHDTRGR